MIQRLKTKFSEIKKKRQTSKDINAQRNVLNELLNDLYLDRGRVYKMNFVRGIFFGLGSALGGTVILAIIIWAVSLFVDFPLIGDTIQSSLNQLEKE